MSKAFEMLTKGNFFGSILQPYVELIGLENFYLIILGMACFFVYMKTRNVGLVGLTLMLTGSVMIPTINPSAQLYFALIIILGASLAIYSVFKGGYT